MSVVKQEDGRYKAEVYLGKKSSGKKARKTKIFNKQKDAKAWEREMKTKYKTGSMDLDEKMLLETYLDYWYETYVIVNTKYNTQKRYKRLLEQIKEKIGHIPLAELKTPIVDRLYTDIKREAKVASGTILKIHRVFRQALEQAVAWDLIVKNPVQYAKPPKDDIRDIKHWTLGEFEIFLAKMQNEQLKLPVLIAFHTGLRLGEVAALRWDDVDLEAGTLMVNNTMVHAKGGVELMPPKSDSSKDDVTLTETLTMTLKKTNTQHKLHKLQTNITVDYVCGWLDGRPMTPNTISRAFKRELEAVNSSLESQLPVITFHGLRHTHASILYDVGASSHEISKRLRHSRVSTTDDIYIHLTDDKKKDTANTFESAINKTAK